VDGFGNAAHLITLRRPHRFLEVTSHGEVETLVVDPFALPAKAPPPLSPAERADYLLPSALVPLDAQIESIAAPFRPSASDDILAVTRRLMNLVYESFTYEQRVTDVFTTVPDIIVARRGVCQDFAHVLIALCRSIQVPARYVRGYIATSRQDQMQSGGGMTQIQSQSQQPRRGADASHAWVEVFTHSTVGVGGNAPLPPEDEEWARRVSAAVGIPEPPAATMPDFLPDRPSRR